MEGCSRPRTYPYRWCHCPRSLACMCTGVLWWCWCRWHSHHTNFGHWHTRHALWERERLAVNVCERDSFFIWEATETVLWMGVKQLLGREHKAMAEILFQQQSSFWTAMFPNIFLFSAWLAHNGFGLHADSREQFSTLKALLIFPGILLLKNHN